MTATDADAGATLTYSITGGTDAALFAINAATGVLTSSPRRTSRPRPMPAATTSTTCRCRSPTAATPTPRRSRSRSPTSTTSPGDHARTAAGRRAAVNVAENTTAVTTVTATDADAGATLTYRIIGGADAALFAINAATGVLSFITAPNFESPADAGGNNVYDVKVQVTDGSNTDTQAIAVTVTDVNESPGDHARTAAGRARGQRRREHDGGDDVTATDADAGATLTYSIGGGADAAQFAINAATGVLTFITRRTSRPRPTPAPTTSTTSPCRSPTAATPTPRRLRSRSLTSQAHIPGLQAMTRSLAHRRKILSTA